MIWLEPGDLTVFENDLTLVGADAADFEIVGTELRLKAGTVLDFETKTSFDVTVEVDDDPLRESSEQASLPRSERRSEHRDRRLHAVGVQRDGVEVPLHQHGVTLPTDGPAGPIQSEQVLALAVECVDFIGRAGLVA